MKLLLFDIDGTLLSARGIPGRAMYNIMRRREPEFRYNTAYNFAGKTDWQIIEHLLLFNDSGADVSEPVVRTLMDEFARELAEILKQSPAPLLFAGVENLLSTLSQNSDFRLALVTGNTRIGAQHKLSAAGIDGFFPVGGFGDDARERTKIPPIAIERAMKYFKQKFLPGNIWIIGDSVPDILCARANQLKCLAVTTGFTPIDELRNYDPDIIVPDFACYEQVINLLMK